VGSLQAIVLVVAIMLCCACGPQTVHRPLEGARPVGDGATAGTEQAGAPAGSGPPPTLSPPGPSPAASPGQSAASESQPAPSPSPSPEPGYFIAATDGRGVNLRDGPSTSARVIVTLAEGTAIEVFGDPVAGAGGPWRKIRSGSREGWVVAGVIRRR
jgi:hypothetical protein